MESNLLLLLRSMNCDKIAYRSKENAIGHLHKIQSTEKDHKIPVRAYQCNECKRWHLTSRENITERAKPIRLKHSDKWFQLLDNQKTKEEFWTEKPYQKQIEKALSIIINNINIQCEVLEERFKFRAKQFRYRFNKRQKEIMDKHKIA